MNKLLLVCCLYSSHVWAQNYDHEKIELLSRWDDTTITVLSQVGSRYSGIWGYASNGREYALLGAENGLHIIDITDPYLPVRIARIYGRRNGCTWREYKVYQHYVYMVSDDPVVNSLQIVDLSFLPDSAVVVYDDATIFKQSHTIFIDGDKLYSGATTFGNGQKSAMSVYSLDNPALPVLLRKLEQDYGSITGNVHDMFVQNDTIYASCGYDGLHVFNLDTANHFQLIGSLTQYSFQGYNHSSCLAADGNHLVMLDEVPEGLPVKSVRINSPNDLEVIDTLSSGSLATPHNPFLCDNNHVAIAYYEDGLQIFDFTNPASPIRTGYFDTHYQTATDSAVGSFAGAWGAYTQLPSKHIIVADMQNGLFVLNADSALGITRINTGAVEVKADAVKVYPNPVANSFRIDAGSGKVESATLYNEVGQLIRHFKNANTELSLRNLPSGFYLLAIKAGGITSSVKLIKE